MEEDLTINPWYFDSDNNPLCPSFWEDLDCDGEGCLFSHKDPCTQIDIPIKVDIFGDTSSLYRYIKDYSTSHSNTLVFQEVRLPSTKEEDKDFDRINQLMTEMINFEKGPEIFDNHILCPFILDTGNCVIRDVCEFAHSADDQKIKDIEKEQEWYPASMACGCCKGYVYGCLAEECRKQGKCLLCVNS
jgi:hypothetical protein